MPCGACQFFCVWGLEVGGDWVGVGGGELGEGLFPVGGGVFLGEACGGCSFVGGGVACVCEALGGSFVFDFGQARVSVRLCTGTDLQVCGEPVGVGHG